MQADPNRFPEIDLNRDFTGVDVSQVIDEIDKLLGNSLTGIARSDYILMATIRDVVTSVVWSFKNAFPDDPT